MHIHRILIGIVMLISFYSHAQYPANPVEPSSNEERIAAIAARKSLNASSSYLGIAATSIGPTIMSGRVVDMAIDPQNSIHFFVAYATGGVWETKNNGQSFSPIFDSNGYTANCGALAVNWENKILYVGTGEANSSRSSYAGYGIFKYTFEINGPQSTQEWENIGLSSTQHISRIILHPKDPNIIYVAAMGNLFSPNKERGIYKTTDGGKTWKQTLYIDENTSAIDIEIHPNNPNKLVAAMWQKSRRAWNFWEGGEKSGVYISSDGGTTWERSAAFPSGEHIGRTGLSVSGNTLYALIDNQKRYVKEENTSKKLARKDFKDMDKEAFYALSDSTLNLFLKRNKLDKKYTPKKLKTMMRKDKLEPKDLFDYWYDSNEAMFEDPVSGAELYRSNDFGVSWHKTHDTILENVCYSYGYYFGVVTANTSDSNHVFIAGVPLLQSVDGGKTFDFAGGDNVHVDHHYIWINPTNPLHLINGNDGGINISYDGAKTWIKCNSPAVGQFYTVAVDNQKKYNVYGGLQDNGTWMGPNDYTYNTAWHQEGKYAYQRIGGGDGMQIQVDPRDNTVYSGSQYGNYMYTDAVGKRHRIHPKHSLREAHLRWNWQTPILLSPHNADRLYIGSNKLHCSKNKAKNFRTISKDLTQGNKEGDVSYGTLSCIDESPIKKGMLYTGSDDGLIHHSPNGGKTWKNRTNGLPQHLWVKEVIASEHVQNSVFAILNGHIWDHFDSYIYLSKNNGIHWKRIGKNLPAEPINTLIEDANNENILYLGTDAGLYISKDGGLSFYPMTNLPIVPVHDLAIQQNHRDLIVATHGRSLYKVQLEPVYQSTNYRDSTFALLPLPTIKHNENWGKLNYKWDTRVPRIDAVFFTQEVDSTLLAILDSENNELLSTSVSSTKGYNSHSILLEFLENISGSLVRGTRGKFYPTKGTYTLVITQNGNKKKQNFLVK